MGTQEFIVLYTHQKLKKAKVWQDGILTISHLGNKAILYDDKGQCLESIFLKCLEVKPGDDLEGDRYLVTIEEVKTAGPTTLGQTVAKAAPGLGKCVPSGRAQGCQPAGLKRKFTGFQGPRQVPPKVVVTENSELAPTLEAKKAGPLFLSSLYDTSPLFSVAGQKDINRPAVAENSVAYENRERNSMLPFSSSAFKIHPEMRGDEHDFCSPVSPENKCSRSFPTDEPMKRDGLSLHHSGVSHSIRSKARILALLKSKPTGVCTELDSELREHRPQVQPHGCGTIPPQPGCSAEQEECAEGKRPEELQYPQLSGNTTGKTSRWAIYLPSQRSPEHSSVEEENDPAGKPKAQEGSLDSRRDILAQKRKHFETCAERGREGNEDNPVDNHDPPWAQEGELESPSSRESSAAPVTFGPVENGDFLSESRIQENRKIRVHQSNPMRLEESLLIRENAEERSRHVEPKEESGQGPEPEHLQTEPSLRTNARLSDDITHVSSESNSDNENLNQISEFRGNVEQPLVEVTFNLNSFEASDTEEEAQGSHKMSQDSEDWGEETSGTDEHSGHQRQHDEDESCKDAGGAHLHLLTSSRGEPTEPLSQFCDKTRVGFYPGLWKAGNTGKEIEQEYNDTLSNFDSSLEWPDDENVDNKEANQSKSSIHNVFIALPNTSKKTETSSLMPHFSNIATNQPSKNNLFSEQAQPFVWGNDSDVNDEQVLFPSTSSYNERVQPLDAKQNHFEERVALGESHTQVSSAFFHPLGTRNPISKDTEVHIPVSKDLERIQKLPQDLMEVETAGGKEYSNSPKTPLEPSGFINDISLLKSLSEHSTALEGLEIMRRRNTTLKQQQSLRTAKPQSCPKAGGPLTTLASQVVPKPPHLDQDSPQMLKENEVEPAEPLQSLEFFSLNTEEEPPFVAFTPKQIEIAACDPQPVEFQGHQVRGSAAGAMMLRRPSTPQGH
ncbi:protein ZGRF1-like, partial [Sorex fumeus]|uniref:protein ZGRF1-like n=1 Tax=Sorex fumeus TaxID=62283 RepID=UPI0024AD0380